MRELFLSPSMPASAPIVLAKMFLHFDSSHPVEIEILALHRVPGKDGTVPERVDSSG